MTSHATFAQSYRWTDHFRRTSGEDRVTISNTGRTSITIAHRLTSSGSLHHYIATLRETKSTENTFIRPLHKALLNKRSLLYQKYTLNIAVAALPRHALPVLHTERTQHHITVHATYMEKCYLCKRPKGKLGGDVRTAERAASLIQTATLKQLLPLPKQRSVLTTRGRASNIGLMGLSR